MENIYIAHHGILGQKWGVRRFQNPDGSLTSNGRKRYNKSETRSRIDKAKESKKDAKLNKKIVNDNYSHAFNRAANYSSIHPLTQYVGERKRKSDAYWKDAMKQAEQAGKADERYKKSKQELKAAKKDRKEAINKQYKENKSKATTAEKLIYSPGTRKKAAQLMVDYKDMPYEVANKKSKNAAWRNSLIASAGVVLLADISSGGELHRAAQRTVMNATNKINPRNITAEGQRFRKVAKNVYRATSPVIRKGLPG